MSAQQSAQDPVSGKFRPRNNANPAGRPSRAARMAQRDRLVEEWAADFGGVTALRKVEVDLLREAAELMVGPKPRTAEDRVRRVNAISKILAQVGLCDRRGKPRSQPAQPNAFAGLVLSGEP